ncbi:hypothetical protein GQ53DRAFT_743598 [Thozetella sp. PMI_491]|nr:hypothetical protein GQ53DRAFT_743598 [Thozetella sp. PMI_491]
MARLSQLLCLPLPSELDAAQQKSRVVYCLSLLSQDSGAASRPEISILESRSLLSAAGTTGLRTWEASLHLGQYLCANPSLVRGKQVLELGAGTGYLSVLCAKFLDASYVVASDGSDDVINNLPDSFYLNNLQGSDKIVPMDLKWGHALVGTEEQAWNAGRQVDLVLGADVTYDQSIIPALVGTMHELVDLFPDVAIVIAATERNKDTFRAFQDACAKSGFLVSHILFPVLPREQQTGPFYNDQTPIHICQLTKAES